MLFLKFLFVKFKLFLFKNLGCNNKDSFSCQNNGTCKLNGVCECEFGFTGFTCSKCNLSFFTYL